VCPLNGLLTFKELACVCRFANTKKSTTAFARLDVVFIDPAGCVPQQPKIAARAYCHTLVQTKYPR